MAYQVRPLLDNCGLGGDRPGQLADLLKHLQYYWILPQGPPKVLVSSQVQDFSAPLSQSLTRKSLGCPTLSPGALDLQVGPLPLLTLQLANHFLPSSCPVFVQTIGDLGGRKRSSTCTEPTIFSESLGNYLLDFCYDCYVVFLLSHIS